MPSRWVNGGSSDEYLDIPVLAFLIQADDRLILVDCGCTPEVVDDPRLAWGKLASLYHPLVGEEDLVDAQIRRAGFELGDITDVILTHLHMDHVGGLQLLNKPRVWLQRAEYRWGCSPDGYAAGGYFRKEYDPPGLDLNLLDGDASIADGVRCILTAGHTIGHQSVLVQLPSQLVCLVGDAAYNRELLDRRSSPALAWNTSEYLATLGRVATLGSFFGANLVFSHDPEQAEKLPRGTDFLH